MIWRVLKYFEHQFFRRYRNGRHIHSPYLFEFVHKVVFNQPGIEIPENIVLLHHGLLKDNSVIAVEDGGGYGAGSKANATESRTISSFINLASVPVKYANLLYRITHWFHPEMILELGTGLGISTIYLAAGAPDTNTHSIEGNKTRATFAQQVIKRSGLNNVKVHSGDLKKELQDLLPQLNGRYVAFVDADHRYEPTVANVRSILEMAGEEAVIVVDDIYWSRGMNQAWKEIILWPQVRMSIDLFHMGILLLRKDLEKAHLKIKF